MAAAAIMIQQQHEEDQQRRGIILAADQVLLEVNAPIYKVGPAIAEFEGPQFTWIEESKKFQKTTKGFFGGTNPDALPEIQLEEFDGITVVEITRVDENGYRKVSLLNIYRLAKKLEDTFGRVKREKRE